MIDMAKALLLREEERNHQAECAVIIIDWRVGSIPPYVQAVSNIRLIGVITAHFINALHKELGLPDLRHVHIIGHSLGAHLAGYAGYHLQHEFGMKLARITGLDPAAPLFENTDPIVRLDRSDAQFVDIIHTDANSLMKGGLGIFQRIGHVDFYPNGGFDNPGCDQQQLKDVMKNRESMIFSTVTEYLGCNHIRSYQYFIESIERNASSLICPFLAINCDSYENFLSQKCAHCSDNGHFCMRMGLQSIYDYNYQLAHGNTNVLAAASSPSMYLMTGDRKPFCRWHYKLRVRIANHVESTLHGGEIGTLSLRLHSAELLPNTTTSKNHMAHNKSSELIKFSVSPMYFEPGHEYTALVSVSGRELSRPKYVTAYWEYRTNLLNPLTWRLLNVPRIFLEYIVIETLEDETFYIKLCPVNDGAIIANNESILLHEAYCLAGSSSLRVNNNLRTNFLRM